MPRTRRTAIGGIVYHVLNRSNGRMALFDGPGDYYAFLRVFAEAHEKVPMRTLAYSVMPNHWHMVLWPQADDHLSDFMHWLTTTHPQRWLTARGMVGFGHVYGGRFKSFPVENDRHYLTVCRYVERNPLRAGLVPAAQDWQWSSLHQRCAGAVEGLPPLTQGPVALPAEWLEIVNTPEPQKDLDAIRTCVARGRPFGDESWVEQAARQLGLQPTLRSRGRPPSPSRPTGH
jgi:putative transposase